MMKYLDKNNRMIIVFNIQKCLIIINNLIQIYQPIQFRINNKNIIVHRKVKINQLEL